MDVSKKPLLKIRNPFTGQIVLVRVLDWCRKSRRATVLSAADMRHTVPLAWFIF